MTRPTDIQMAELLATAAERAMASGDRAAALKMALHAQALLDRALAPARRDLITTTARN